jgi:cholesterol oxidase
MSFDFDAIVVGSGFGGGTLACRLAQAGRKVCVLERGRRWKRDEFPRSPQQSAHLFWDRERSNGLLEYRAFDKMDVLCASGVGGGSLVYFNVRLRPRDEVFTPPRWPARITPRVMAPYFDRVETTLPHETFEPVPPLPRSEAFARAATAAGWAPEPMPLAIRTQSAPSGQGTCVLCGNCLIGCREHAKNTVDLNYIALADREGADIRPLHEVTSLEPLRPGWRVRVRMVDEGRDVAVTAREVVLAAGVLGTNELLLRCRDVHRTLPDLPSMLGRRFSGNGDYIYSGAVQGEPASDPAVGPTITVGTQVVTANHLVYLQDLGLPEPFTWYAEGVNFGGRQLRDLLELAGSYMRQLAGGGPLLTGRAVNSLLSGGVTSNLIFYLAMGTDASDGQIRLDKKGRADVHWKVRNSRPLYRELRGAARKLSQARQARFFPSPVAPLDKALTAHPLGGCVIGETPDSSVTNHAGAVFARSCDSRSRPRWIRRCPSRIARRRRTSRSSSPRS